MPDKKLTATESSLQRLADKGLISQRTANKAIGKAQKDGISVSIGRPRVIAEREPKTITLKPMTIQAGNVSREPRAITLKPLTIQAGDDAPLREKLRRFGVAAMDTDKLVETSAPPVEVPDQQEMLTDLGGDRPGQVAQDAQGRRYFIPAYGPLAGERIEIKPGRSVTEAQDFAMGPPGATPPPGTRAPVANMQPGAQPIPIAPPPVASPPQPMGQITPQQAALAEAIARAKQQGR